MHLECDTQSLRSRCPYQWDALSSKDEICHTRSFDTSGCWVWCSSFKPKCHTCRTHLNAAKDYNATWSQCDYSLFGLHFIMNLSQYAYSLLDLLWLWDKVIMTTSFINTFFLIMTFNFVNNFQSFAFGNLITVYVTILFTVGGYCWPKKSACRLMFGVHIWHIIIHIRLYYSYNPL
jgi:hypothetical protein